MLPATLIFSEVERENVKANWCALYSSGFARDHLCGGVSPSKSFQDDIRKPLILLILFDYKRKRLSENVVFVDCICSYCLGGIYI